MEIKRDEYNSYFELRIFGWICIMILALLTIIIRDHPAGYIGFILVGLKLIDLVNDNRIKRKEYLEEKRLEEDKENERKKKLQIKVEAEKYRKRQKEIDNFYLQFLSEKDFTIFQELLIRFDEPKAENPLQKYEELKKRAADLEREIEEKRLNEERIKKLRNENYRKEEEKEKKRRDEIKKEEEKKRIDEKRRFNEHLEWLNEPEAEYPIQNHEKPKNWYTEKKRLEENEESSKITLRELLGKYKNPQDALEMYEQVKNKNDEFYQRQKSIREKLGYLCMANDDKEKIIELLKKFNEPDPEATLQEYNKMKYTNDMKNEMEAKKERAKYTTLMGLLKRNKNPIDALKMYEEIKQWNNGLYQRRKKIANTFGFAEEENIVNDDDERIMGLLRLFNEPNPEASLRKYKEVKYWYNLEKERGKEEEAKMLTLMDILKKYDNPKEALELYVKIKCKYDILYKRQTKIRGGFHYLSVLNKLEDIEERILDLLIKFNEPDPEATLKEYKEAIYRYDIRKIVKKNQKSDEE